MFIIELNLLDYELKNFFIFLNDKLTSMRNNKWEKAWGRNNIKNGVVQNKQMDDQKNLNIHFNQILPDDFEQVINVGKISH